MDFKRVLKWLPEIYFIAFCVWWAAETSGLYINYPAILLGGLLLLQFWIRIRVIGIVVSTLFFVGSAYLILALYSDAIKAPEVNVELASFILKGAALIAANITLSIILFRKYLSQPTQKIRINLTNK
jgi:hypothetical protein